MSKALILKDELSGFYPGNQGSAVVVYPFGDAVAIATKYAVEFDDDSVTADGDGWEWGLGSTILNKADAIALRDYLTARIEEME